MCSPLSAPASGLPQADTLRKMLNGVACHKEEEKSLHICFISARRVKCADVGFSMGSCLTGSYLKTV